MIDLACAGQLAVRVEVVVNRTDANIARRQDEIAVIYGADYIHHTELVSFQLQRIDIHHDLPIAATEGLGHRRAGNIRDLVSHVILAQVT